MTSIRAVAFVLVILTSTSGAAQSLVTDRPDATESSSTVDVGAVQFETGFEASSTDGASVVQSSMMLARIGLASFAELRVAPPSQVSVAGVSSFADPSLGVKFAGQIQGDTAAGLILQSTLPVVNAGSGAELSAIATGATSLGPVGLGVNLGASLGPVTDDGNTGQVTGLGTLALGYGVTDHIGVFLEGYVTIPEQGEVQPVIDGGVTYLLVDWLQLDVYSGAGLSDAAPDWLAGAGVSVLLPPSTVVRTESEEQ